MSRRPAPPLALLNGKIITANPRFDIAQAMFADAGRIVAVGSNQDIQRLVTPATRVIDLAGRAVVPGLVDAHAHMDREGLKEALPSMAGVRSIDDVLQRIAQLAAQRAPGEWIVTMPLGEPPEFEGMPQLLKEGRFPTRQDLDRVAPDNPVFIKPGWGYWRVTLPLVGIANSMALERAGITRETVSPAASLVIDREADGTPTGIFYDHNFMPILELTLMRCAPEFDLDTRISALRRSMQIYNSYGTTSVFEGHGACASLIAAYQHVRNEGATVRATLLFSPVWRDSEVENITAAIRDWGAWLADRGLGDEWLRVQGVYTELDQTPELALRRAASPSTGWAGFNYAGLPREAVRALLTECARTRIRVEVIGTGLLELMAEVATEHPISDQRWILAHVDSLDDRQFALVRELGLCITTHTNGYLYKRGAVLRDRLGADREHEISPLRRMLDEGVPVSLATDNVPVSLWHPIWQVISRIDRTIDAPIAADQALTREEALYCATMGGAYLTFEEDIKGSIEPGKLADVAVLSQDPLACELDDLKHTVAEITIVGGSVVYERAQE